MNKSIGITWASVFVVTGSLITFLAGVFLQVKTSLALSILLVCTLCLLGIILFCLSQIREQTAKIPRLEKQFFFVSQSMKFLFEESAAPAYVKNENGRILYANPAFKRLMALPDYDPDKTASLASLPKAFAEFESRSDESVLNSGKSQLSELTISTGGKKDLPILVAKHRVKGANDEYWIIGLIVELEMLTGTTSRLRKLLTAVEGSPVSIVITDIDGTIEYANKQFEVLTGYSRKEVIGKNPKVLKSGEQDSKFYKQMWDTILSGETWRGEFHNQKKDGTLFWEDATIVPIKGNGDRITHFVAVKENISPLKEALWREQKAELTAEAAVQSRSEFLRNLSSEVRSPVALVTDYAKILYLDQSLGKESRSVVQEILGKSVDILSMLDNIEEAASMALDGVSLNPTEFDILKVVNEVMGLFKHKAEELDLKFSLEVKLASGSLVCQDEKKVRMIIMNLLSNAFECTTRGQVKVSMMAMKSKVENVPKMPHPINGMMAIEILDTGTGDHGELPDDIFEGFSISADESTGKKPYSLRQAISQQHARLMGGDLKRVWSEPGRGSLFRADLPVAFLSQDRDIEDNRTGIFQHSLIEKSILLNEPLPFKRKVLPPDLRSKLYEAAVAGDLMKLSDIVENVKSLQPEAGTHMEKWLSNLRVDRFQQVFDPDNQKV